MLFPLDKNFDSTSRNEGFVVKKWAEKWFPLDRKPVSTRQNKEFVSKVRFH